MTTKTIAARAVCLLLLASSAAWAIEPTPDETYKADDTWLCRPGRDDLCSKPVTVTSVKADGTRSTITIQPDAAAPIDCFYVYPTISMDPGGNSPLTAGPGEKRAVEHQFAPFASVCRPYAPMYRQITLAGLRSLMNNGQLAVNVDLGLEDVRAAWRYYLANDNKGRGVVLIGHSQGTRVLMELMRRDIEGQPAQKLLVSAVIPGIPVMVAAGSDVGGTFKSIPLCRSATQTGCVIAFSTFRETSPPPANARFGRSTTAGQDVACVDAAALSGSPAHAYLPVKTNLTGRVLDAQEWTSFNSNVASPFVELPGLANVACVKDGPNSFLSVKFDPTARGTRPADVPFDITVQGKVWDDWGLHLIDVNVVMGNLLEVVKRQGAAFNAAKR